MSEHERKELLSQAKQLVYWAKAVGLAQRSTRYLHASDLTPEELETRKAKRREYRRTWTRINRSLYGRSDAATARQGKTTRRQSKRAINDSGEHNASR